MKMWIQLHDFSSEEIGNATEEQARQALSTFDWQREIQREKESSPESCPPGLGLVSDSNEILHICPGESDSCSIHYHYPVSKKVLGFIPVTDQESHFVESCSLAKAMDAIGCHFAGRREGILALN